MNGVTQTLPYGSWPSPVDAASVAAASPRFEGACFVGDEVWWGVTVPHESGRVAVRRRSASGVVTDVLPAPWNARSRVHEYGGGSWTVSPDGVLFFVDNADQAVRMLRPGGTPQLLTSVDPAVRFGGLTWQYGRVLAVREFAPEGGRTRHDIVEITQDGGVAPLVAGSDFVAQPAMSPDGTQLAWIAWNHPDMPWDRTKLRVGRIGSGVVSHGSAVAAGDSVPLQPVWTGQDEMLFVDDPTGRWNLWRMRLGDEPELTLIAPVDADTGGPLWGLGARWFHPLDDGRIIAVRTQGRSGIVAIDPVTATATPVPLDAVADLTINHAQGTSALISGIGAAGSPALWLIDVDEPDEPRLLAGGGNPWGAEWMPAARTVTYAGPHGPVHAFDYAPTSPVAVGPENELPPYVVFVHGGPTGSAAATASGKIAFFTSRGIGALEVDYGGSSGYGRAYRERLRGQWGVVDVDDVAAAAVGLVAEGRADPARLAIEGGSAGGWTVLSALANTDVFAAGISRYGVGDARALATETHDFEAHYLDGLIGPLPEAEELYIERSPLTHPERFRVPVLLLQGTDDAVVPPRQSEAIRDALAARGIPHAYTLYPGEGHGFRRAETAVDALERELAFLAAVFDLNIPGVEPLPLS